MDIIEAIMARRSVRDFSPRAVPKETVIRILEAAIRSPSGGNAQPWEVFVAAGETLERIRKTYQELGWPGFPQRPGNPPPVFPSQVMQRSGGVIEGLAKLAGLDPADPERFRIVRGSRLFGAPVIVIICMDKGLNDRLGIGLFVQTLCLAAQGYGVDSIIAGSLMAHPEVLRGELEIPDSLDLITGIALGYPSDNVINTYRSPRRPIEEVVRYRE